MRFRGVAVTLSVSAVCFLAAGYCWTRASKLRSEAAWQLARGNALAQEYAVSLESASAEAQLKSFDDRREALASAHRWQRLQFVLVLAAVALAFSAYVLRLLSKLREDLVALDEHDAPTQLPP